MYIHNLILILYSNSIFYFNFIYFIFILKLLSRNYKGKCWCLWKPLKLDIHLQHNSLTSPPAQHMIFIGLNHRFYFIYDMYEEKSGYDRRSSHIVFFDLGFEIKMKDNYGLLGTLSQIRFFFVLFFFNNNKFEVF